MTKPSSITHFRRYGSDNRLTPTEKKTLALAEKGMTRKQMAEDLKIEMKTLAQRMHIIRHKLEAGE